MFPTVKSPKDWTGYGRTNLYENTLTVMMIMHCQSSDSPCIIIYTVCAAVSRWSDCELHLMSYCASAHIGRRH